MFEHRLRKTCIVLLLAFATTAPACADGPRAAFKLDTVATVYTSPDQTVRVEPYARDTKGGGLLFQFWTFDGDHRHPFLLNPGEGDDLAGYAAGFRFSADSQWLVRIQKLGAGYSTLFLYRRKGYQFSSATAKPLGDMAWDYFFTAPASKGMHRDPKDPYSLDHANAALIQGMDDNYAGIGEHWPDSRYVVISLSFGMQGADKPGPWIEGWRCVYDLKTGTFSVPAEFAQHNAETIKNPAPRSQ
jgi:hypothetical protein